MYKTGNSTRAEGKPFPAIEYPIRQLITAGPATIAAAPAEKKGKHMNWIEMIGYIGSGLVLVSMLMRSVVRLRVINMIGSVIFAIYALLIRSYPTALMNGALVVINIWHLLHMSQPARHFSVYEDRPDSAWVSWLLRHYREDIARHFPDFSMEALAARPAKVFVVLQDSEAAGLFIGLPRDDALEVLLDYATPTYRDCSVGEALFPELARRGVRSVVWSAVPESLTPYVRRMGFELQPGGGALKRL